MAAYPERVDELLHARRLVDVVGQVDADVGAPADGVVGDTQGGEDVLVEAALPDEQLVHDLEEFAGAGALDDAVVIGGGQGDGLADRQLDEVFSDAPWYSAGYWSAPAPMMQPWPFISRGTECSVPMPPGLVSEIVVPGSRRR